MTTPNTQKRNPSIGSVSTDTLRPEDLLAAFSDALDELEKRTHPSEWASALLLRPEDSRGEVWKAEAGRCIEELKRALNEHSPDFCRFGAHEGDCADFGFWPDWHWLEVEGSVLKVEDIVEDIPEYFLHFNDHGSCELFRVRLERVWAVV